MNPRRLTGLGALAAALAILILLPACAASDVPTPAREVPPLDEGHQRYAAILAEVVDGDQVRYARLQELRADLDAYRAQLAATTIPKQHDAAMALWINAYNALTLALVLETLPEDRSAWSGYSVREVSGFWKRYRFEVGGKRVTLDEIEHGILRPMGDPRIHFAVNCASASCPRLIAEPYTADGLEEQLAAAANHFADSEEHLRLADGELRANPILDWFGGDFDSVGGVRAFLIDHTTREDLRAHLEADKPIRFFAYDWSLNLAE